MTNATTAANYWNYESFRRADAVWITTEENGTVRLRRGTFADSPDALWQAVGADGAVEFVGYLGATADGVEFDEVAWTINAAEFAAFISDPDFVPFAR